MPNIPGLTFGTVAPMRVRACIAAVGVIALAACGDPATSTPTDTTPAAPSAPPAAPSAPSATSAAPPTSTQVIPMPTPPDTPPPTPPATAPVGDPEFAIADLRGRVGPDGDIEFVSQEEVTWRDGSLGCPQPGWSYTQALVNGTRIVLRHDGILYEYHSGGRRRPFYCPPQFVEPPSGAATAEPGPGA